LAQNAPDKSNVKAVIAMWTTTTVRVEDARQLEMQPAQPDSTRGRAGSIDPTSVPLSFTRDYVGLDVTRVNR